MRDHSGQCPVQYLENIGPATEQSDWLILVIGPLNQLSRVINLDIVAFQNFKLFLLLPHVCEDFGRVFATIMHLSLLSRW